MAAEYVSLRNIKFLLHDVHGVSDLAQFPYYSEYDDESIDMIVDTIKELADTYFFPYLEECDRHGVTYENGTVKVHPQVLQVMKNLGENGWIGAAYSADVGGMQLPHMVAILLEYMFAAANNNLNGYPGLTAGAAGLVISFASDELKKTYVEKMLSGRWQGTMALTEPHAGSSLSDITTTASPNDDGSYQIKGTKTFISSGDYEGIENVVHLTLAKIEGAPAGVKGISLFVVPKKRPTANGKLEPNGVVTAGIFHKLGQKGYVTTQLSMGDDDDCRGWLVGKPHYGLAYMFQMMNASRISVGCNAAGIVSAAYHASLEYARDRIQGRRLNNKDLTVPQTEIINHPDIRRMLFMQKSISEGALSLVLQCTRYEDLHHVTDGEEKENNWLLLELLTPLVKTFPADVGMQAVSNGLQVLGGSGFCDDYPLEQYYRDIRIMSIYEGTTGIQSLDLLGRKMQIKEGKAFKLFLGEVQKTIGEAMAIADLQKHAEQLKSAVEKLVGVAKHLGKIAATGDIELSLADATLYQQMFSLVAVAWQWLKQGIAAHGALKHQSKAEDDLKFYQSKIQTLRYYYVYELPEIDRLAQTMTSGERLTVQGDMDLLV